MTKMYKADFAFGDVDAQKARAKELEFIDRSRLRAYIRREDTQFFLWATKTKANSNATWLKLRHGLDFDIVEKDTSVNLL